MTIKNKLFNAAANGDLETIENLMATMSSRLICAQDEHGLFPG